MKWLEYTFATGRLFLIPTCENMGDYESWEEQYDQGAQAPDL